MSVIVHSKVECPLCVKAKEFLAENNSPYVEEMYDPAKEDYEERKNVLLERTKYKTFPQIFVGERFVGGYNDLLLSHSTMALHDWLKEVGVELECDMDF